MDALRIGEVARRTGLTVRTLRHYDDLGLLVPSERSAGDYRLYSDADLRRLLAIGHLKSLGLSLDDIGRALDDPGFDAASALAQHVALVEERLAAERELLRRLRRLQHAADWQSVLDAIQLTELLRHPDAGVRLRATLAAPRAAAVETLVDQLLGDPSAGVREGLTWALVQHGRAATPALVARAADRDPAVRLQVAHALSKLADPDAVGALAALLLDHDPAVAAKAAFALGRLGGEASEGGAGGEAALDALLDVVGVAEPVVRDAVADAVAALVGEQEVARLAELLADPHPSVREHAAEILGLVGDPAGVPALVAALGDPDAGVRFAALLALGQVEDDEAGRAVEGLVESPDERTRLVAARLVGDRSVGDRSVSDRRAGGPPRR